MDRSTDSIHHIAYNPLQVGERMTDHMEPRCACGRCGVCDKPIPMTMNPIATGAGWEPTCEECVAEVRAEPDGALRERIALHVLDALADLEHVHESLKDIDRLLASAPQRAGTEAEPEVILGVGDGFGNLFVRGSWEAIQRVKALISENERLRALEKREEDRIVHTIEVPYWCIKK